MSKKLTKTIILIVFVVLLGIKDVEGKKLSCNYEGSENYTAADGTVTTKSYSFNFEIDSNDLNESPSFKYQKDGRQAKYSAGSMSGMGDNPQDKVAEIKNWKIPNNVSYTVISGFSDNKSCPEHFVVRRISNRSGAYSSDSDEFYAVSSEKLEEMKSAIESQTQLSVHVVNLTKEEILEEDTEPELEPDPEPEEEEEDNSEHPGVGEGGRVSGDTGSKGYCGVVDDKPTMKKIPAEVPRITKFIYNFLQVLVPLAIIILGSIDLVKAISAQKEDEIKKGQQMLIKRLITAVIVFFVFALVKLLVSIVSDNSNGIVDCINCFIGDVKYCNFTSSKQY